MTENEIKEIYEREKEFYQAWGNMVKETVLAELSNSCNIDKLIKVPVVPRLKEMDSLLEKIMRPNKTYKDPYNDITDKVGVRFVVLLTQEVFDIGDIIKGIPLWAWSEDRNFEDERLAHPTIFEYQSCHYVIRNNEELNYEGISIPQGTPCEIQVRTLLQHAYSELTHDTTYKPNGRITPDILRIIARSMALIETTDSLFMEVNKLVDSEEKILSELNSIYAEFVEPIPDLEKKLNLLIIDAYKEFIGDNFVGQLRDYFSRNTWQLDLIRVKHDDSLFYRQPVILLLYYLIPSHRKQVRELWPYTEEKLRPMYNDFGVALN